MEYVYAAIFEQNNYFIFSSRIYDNGYKYRIWVVYINNGNLKYKFDSTNGGHTSDIMVISSISDGIIASGSTDFTVKVWDLVNGSLKFTFSNENGGHNNKIIFIGALANGNIVTSSTDRSVRVWDQNTGIRVNLFTTNLNAQTVNILSLV